MECGVKWQLINCWTLLFVVLVVAPAWGGTESLSESSNLERLIARHVRDGKKALAQSFLKTQLRDRDTVSIAPAFTWKLGTFQGTAVSTFRSFNQSFILAGQVLYRVQEQEVDRQGLISISTEPVAEFEGFLGEIMFVESVQWDGMLFLLAAYKQGLLQLFTVSSNNTIILRQTINSYGVPSDSEFFLQDEKLFLVVVANNASVPAVPVVVYRWVGTHLDEENRVLLNAPVAVATFSFRESVMVVVALRSVGMQKAGLAVLRQTGTKLVKVHYLPVVDPLHIQHYIFRSENYLLVTSATGPGTILWWSGTELTEWDKLEGVEGVNSVAVGYVRGETIITVADKTMMKTYRPTETSLQLLDTQYLNTTVHSASLYTQSHSIVLMAITKAASGSFVPYVYELRLVFQPPSASQYRKENDPLVNCFIQLRENLSERRKILKDMSIQRNHLLRKSEAGIFNGKLTVQKLEPKNVVIRRVELRPAGVPPTYILSGEEVKRGFTEALSQVRSLNASLRNVVSKTRGDILTGRLVADELEIENSQMDSVIIEELNGVKFDPKKLLRYSKDQEITGIVTVERIVADSAQVNSLNGHKVQDLLTRRGDDQVMISLKEVPHVTTTYVQLTDINVINNISLNDMVTVGTQSTVPITGTKTFSGLNLQSLFVHLINNENFTHWVESLVPQTPIQTNVTVETILQEAPDHTVLENLKVVNLTVRGHANNENLDDVLSSLFLRGYNQVINGDITYSSNPTVMDLTSSKINWVPTASLLTKTTDQSVPGTLTVGSVSAPDLYADSINGININRDVAYVNSQTAVSSPVAFRNLNAGELGLPPQAVIQGRLLGSRLDHQPLIKYERKVIVKGNVTLMSFNLEKDKFKLNGKTFSFRDVPLQYWTKSSKQVITIPLTARAGIQVKSLTVGRINSLQPEYLVNLHSTQLLKGDWSFGSATIFGDLSHSSSAVQIPVSPSALDATVVRTTGNYSISGLKVFSGGLTTAEMDAVYLDSRKVQDFLLNQYSGGKFGELHIGGDLVLQSDVIVHKVNGITLCERLSKAVMKDRPSRISSALMSAMATTQIDLQTLDGIPFVVWEKSHNSTAIRRIRKVVIKGNAQIPGFINVLTVNNKDVSTDYLAKVVDRTVSGALVGKKTIVGPMVVHGNYIAFHYHGVDLKDMYYNGLSRTRPQIIPHKVTVKRLTAAALNTKVINGIPVSDLMSSEQLSRQTIHGDLIFVNGLEVDGVMEVGNFENKCDLNGVASRLNQLDGRKWTSITVNSNLKWNNSLSDVKMGLGYFMKNAVTKDGDQAIVGEVVFGGAVATNNVNSLMDINDVSIGGIMKDSLRKSVPHQVVTGAKIFHRKLSATTMRIEGNVVAKVVSGVDIPNLNYSLVRIEEDREVRGHKHFLRGFSADMMKVDGLLNDYPTSMIVNYDMPNLPPMVFAATLDVQGDLNFGKVNDFSLYDLLEGRVTLDGDQQVHGRIVFDRDLGVEGNMTTTSINNVDIVDIVVRDSDEEQFVRGMKQFTQNVRVDGSVEVKNLLGMELRMAYHAALFRDENAVISGNFVFGSGVGMEQDLIVNDLINNEKMTNVAERLRSHAVRDLSRVRSVARTINDTNAYLRARGDLSELLYLERASHALPALVQTKSAVCTDIGDGQVRVDIFGWEWSSGQRVAGSCGLPAHCACPTQFTLQARDNTLDLAALVRSNASTRSFRFRTESGLLVRVLTTSVSTSSRCRLSGEEHLDEVTTISWMVPNQISHSSEVFADVTVDPSPILGYLSDAKLFSVNGMVYVVLGLAYNADLDSTELQSVILRLDTNKRRARIVGEFPTQGVAALDVFHTNKGAHLVVGNSFASKTRSSRVAVDIYRFDAFTERLKLMRSIPAKGVVAVASVVQGGDSIIIIAQEQLYAPVLVLKYDAVRDDYYFFQQLSRNTLPTGLNVFYVGQPERSDAFLGVSTSDHMFYLYKYCHIEGFKPVMDMELEGVQGFTSFSVGSKQFLYFTSTQPSAIFEVVKQS